MTNTGVTPVPQFAKLWLGSQDPNNLIKFLDNGNVQIVNLNTGVRDSYSPSIVNGNQLTGTSGSKTILIVYDPSNSTLRFDDKEYSRYTPPP